MEASAHENGTLLTEALLRIAAEQARVHDLLQREGGDTMAPACRAYWATKRTIAERVIVEWSEIAKTGRVRPAGYIEKALTCVLV